MCDDLTSHEPTRSSLSRRSALVGLGGLAAGAALVACTPAATSQMIPAASGDPSRDKLELVLLGTQAGPPPVLDRAGISTALVVDGAVYLVDCGRGSVTQYGKADLKFDALKGIFLTHLHADHIADYYNYLLLAGWGEVGNVAPVTKTSVYGPGPAGGLPTKFGGGTAPTVSPDNPTPGTLDMTNKLHEAYAYSTNIFLRDSGIPDIRELASINEIRLPAEASYTNTHPEMKPIKVMQDDRVVVTATLVPHGPVFPSFAYRFDTEYGSVTFSGDTAESENLIALAQGTDALVHEAINIRGAKVPDVVRSHMLESHVEVQNVGNIARRARAGQLVLTHIGDLATRPLNREQWQGWAKQGYEGAVTIGEDLQRIPIEKIRS